jgi:hypothetical protein
MCCAIPVLSKGFRPAVSVLCVGFLFLVRCRVSGSFVCTTRYGHAVSSLAECSLWELGRRR